MQAQTPESTPTLEEPMAINDILPTLLEEVSGWMHSFIALLPNLVVAALVVLAFVFGARLVSSVVQNLLDRISDNRQVNGLLATVVKVAVLAIGFFIALGIVGLDKTVTTLLAGLGVLGLALGFAFQDIAANFMAGVLMAIRRPFREGDIIESNGFIGIVEGVNLRSTRVRRFQGPIVIIPNKDVFGNPIENYSLQGQRRVDLACGVSYGDDLEQARAVAITAIEALPQRDTSRDVELFYDEFGDSSINFKLRFWITFKKQTDYLGAQSEAVIRLKKAFDAEGIVIPFPIRTLDFGVSGGEKLNEVLPKGWYERNGSRPETASAPS